MALLDSEAAAAWVSAGVSALVGLVTLSASYAVSIFRQKKMEEDLTDLEGQVGSLQDKLGNGGEPRVVSVQRCTDARASCRELHDERQDRVDARLASHDDKLDDLLQGVARIEAKLPGDNDKRRSTGPR